MPGERRSRNSAGRRSPGALKRRKPRNPAQGGSSSSAARFEAEVLPGLATRAAAELEELGAEVVSSTEDAVLFDHQGPGAELLGLRRTVAVYRVLHFDVPRPKALLGHEHLTRLIDLVSALRKGPPAQQFDGFRFGAAGSDSPVFSRLAGELAAATGLPQREEGELLLRFRPASSGGWEVLGRLTPRPLSARPWRECNLPGGLNATVAAAALDLLGSGPEDRFLNLMCGSGTLLIERGMMGKWSRGVGLDLDRQAIKCAERNVAAAGLSARATLLAADATALPFADQSFDRLSADLPWGDAVGGHSENARLYPAFLEECGRVAVAGARLLVITHEIRLFQVTLGGQRAWRQLGEAVRVFHGGHRPGLYLLERST